MSAELAYEFPPFDTGQYESSEFHMHGSDAALHVNVAELGTIIIASKRVRWHQFVALPNCSAAVVSSAYFRLVEINSPALRSFLKEDKSPRKAYPHERLDEYRAAERQARLDGAGLWAE